jgi:hypothetical protein
VKTIKSQIPDSLYKQVKSLAERESISVDQLISIALAGQVSAWLTKDYPAESPLAVVGTRLWRYWPNAPSQGEGRYGRSKY